MSCHQLQEAEKVLKIHKLEAEEAEAVLRSKVSELEGEVTKVSSLRDGEKEDHRVQVKWLNLIDCRLLDRSLMIG